MRTTSGIRQRQLRTKNGIGLPGDNNHILAVARRLSSVINAPVLGGIAVFLHGGGRSSVDLDLFANDRQKTGLELEAAGAVWDAENREYVLDGVRIHTVTPEDARVAIEKAVVIDGVRVVTLRDLVAIKMICGLQNPGRCRDIADVEELIRVVPLEKTYAARLPEEVRTDFKELVAAVRASEKPRGDGVRF